MYSVSCFFLLYRLFFKVHRVKGEKYTFTLLWNIYAQLVIHFYSYALIQEYLHNKLFKHIFFVRNVLYDVCWPHQPLSIGIGDLKPYVIKAKLILPSQFNTHLKCTATAVRFILIFKWMSLEGSLLRIQQLYNISSNLNNTFFPPYDIKCQRC